MPRLPIVDNDDGAWGGLLNSFLEVSLDNVNVDEALRGRIKPAAIDTAGGVMNTDTSTTDMQFVVDEDNMASDSATKLPTQQSVKAYVDTSIGSTGAVSGPATATDNAVVRYDGITGKLVQNSGVLISDSDTLTINGKNTTGDVVLNVGDNFRLARYTDNTGSNIGDYIFQAKNNSSLLDIFRISYSGVEFSKLAIPDLHIAPNGLNGSSGGINFADPSANYEFRLLSEGRIFKLKADHTNSSPSWSSTLLAIENATGNVGIGNSSPNAKLDVTGEIRASTAGTASSSVVTVGGTQTLTSKTITSPVINTGVSGTAIDTDGTLAANSDTIIASQKATKTYVDTTANKITSPNIKGGIAFRTPKLNNWFSQLQDAQNSVVDVVIIADSIGLTTGNNAQSWPNAFGRFLADRFGTNKESRQFLFPKNNFGFPVMDTCEGTTISPATGLGGWAVQMSNGQKATATDEIDAVSVLYTKSPGAGSIEVRDGVGGTLLTTISTAGTAKSSNIWTSADLTLASHTIELTSVGNTVLEGVYMHLQTKSAGVRVWPATHEGYKSSDFTSDNTRVFDLIDNLNPALVIVATGVNDTSYSASVPTLVTAVKAHTTKDVATWFPYRSDLFTKARELDGRTALDSLDTYIIDAGLGLGYSFANDYCVDKIHPGKGGIQLLARHVYASLVGDPVGAMNDNLKVLNAASDQSNPSWRDTNTTVDFPGVAGDQVIRLSQNDTSSSIGLVSNGTLSSLIGMPGAGMIIDEDTNIAKTGPKQLSINSGEGTLQANLSPSINAQTGTAYTLIIADAGKHITRSNGSASTQTLPQNSDVAFPIGVTIPITNLGAGLVTFVAGTGASIVGGTTLGTNEKAEMTKVSTNGWHIKTGSNAAIDIDTTLAANSDIRYPSQKAVKTYIDTVSGSSGGSIVVQSKNSNYTVVAGDDVILVDATSGNINIGIITAVGRKRALSIKKVDSSSNTVTATASGSEKIDGAATAVIASQYESITLVSDNTNYFIT